MLLPAPEQAPTPARSAALSPEAEARLLQFFSSKDMLSYEDARNLAQMVSLHH